MKSIQGVIDELIEEKMAKYDQSCIIGNISCPIPDGAELSRYNYDITYYLSGHRVGPQEIWTKGNNAGYYLAERLCRNAAGQANR